MLGVPAVPQGPPRLRHSLPQADHQYRQTQCHVSHAMAAKTSTEDVPRFGWARLMIERDWSATATHTEEHVRHPSVVQCATANTRELDLGSAEPPHPISSRALCSCSPRLCWIRQGHHANPCNMAHRKDRDPTIARTSSSGVRWIRVLPDAGRPPHPT